MKNSPTRRKLEHIRTEYEHDPNFALLRRGALQYVPGEGPTKPVAVILGEAPGRNEDESGRPFVGVAGQILDDLIDGVGLTRGDFYVTNVVKYRPNKNRTPTTQEVRWSHKYLVEELGVVSATNVIAMGKVALEALFWTKGLPSPPIGQSHGYSYDHLIEDTVVWSTYHPAATSYKFDPQEKAELLEVLVDDFQYIIGKIL